MQNGSIPELLIISHELFILQRTSVPSWATLGDNGEYKNLWKWNPKWLSLSLQNKILTPATNDRADYISTCGMWVLTIDAHSRVTQATNGSQVAWELLKNLNLPFQPNPNFLPPNLSV